MVLFDIIRYSFNSMIWGILIAIACMVSFVLLIKGWYKNATFSPVSYIVGFILFLVLSFQCVLIIGSLKIIDMSDEYEKEVTAIVESVYSPLDEVTQQQASDIINSIIEEFPILRYYISGGEFSGFSAKELPHAISLEIRSFMRWYIFRRILWCIGFVLVGAICVIKSMSRDYARIRSNRIQSIQHDRRRVTRRPRK